MLTAYKFSDRLITLCQPSDSPDWIDLAEPADSELKLVEERYQLPAWFLTDPLDPRERPRVDQDGECVLLVIRLSYHSAEPDGPHFKTVPVGVIIAKNIVVTICARPDLVSSHMKSLYSRKRDWSCVRLAFGLFYVAGTGFIDNLESMEAEANRSEARLRQSTRNEEILTILSIEKSLINLTTALKSNHALMEKFQRPDPLGLTLTHEERDLLDDAMTENQQAIFMADIFGQVLSTLSDAFGTIISNNLNKIMKFLAGVTIVLTIPMIVAGFYGMNVQLPGASPHTAFWAICVFCLALMLLVSLLFSKKDWF
ncbi:hypothetical protein C4J81_05240 [Deltaproteobacteria bacterium Smac51]|nr:hypothetical protein C4J81_05240 [Deltaproteobacteria bacterium Smac51]